MERFRDKNTETLLNQSDENRVSCHENGRNELKSPMKIVSMIVS